MSLKCKRTDELEKEIQTNDKTWGQMEGNNDRTLACTSDYLVDNNSTKRDKRAQTCGLYKQRRVFEHQIPDNTMDTEGV